MKHRNKGKRAESRIAKLLLTLFMALPIALPAQEQEIGQVLAEVERNNPELSLATEQMQKEIAEAGSSNRLNDPRFSYTHLWNKDDSKAQIGEMVLSQEFDFPGLYISRGKEAKLKQSASQLRWKAERQRILLEAKVLCLELIALQKQMRIRRQVVGITEDLLAKYQSKIEQGETSILALRRLQAESLNAKTSLRLAEIDLNELLRKLQSLNGGKKLGQLPREFPSLDIMGSAEALWQELSNESPELNALKRESLASKSGISRAQMQGWPKIELGYRRNTEPNTALNGLVVGLSIPLFSNKNEVKIARSEARYAEAKLQKESDELKLTFMQQYREASTLFESLEAYRQFQSSDKAIDLLKMALDGGQISLIEYLSELEALQEVEQNRIELSSRYHKAQARLLAHKL